MRAERRLRFVFFSSLFLIASIATAQSPSEKNRASALDQGFQNAVTAYEAGKFSEASTQMERLLVLAPRSFDLHEMLGLSYAAQSQEGRALEQMEIAAQLRPDSVTARSNLATALVHVGRPDDAKREYLAALKLQPADYDANRGLAGLYLQANQIADALPLLEAAQRIRPAAYDNEYDLALAYLLTGHVAEAKQKVLHLTEQKDSGELHNLLGRIDEEQDKYVEAANEFSTAAHMEPSEDNLFVWANELLLHRTYVPAIDVFRQATQRYPHSARLFIGLGMSLYSRGEYEEAIRSLLAAADLDPADPRCYMFLSKAFLISPSQAEIVIERFRRYAELEPRSALAQYYYAISLWKGRRMESLDVEYPAVERLLKESISLDGTNADAHLQLGILYTDHHDYEKSLPEYERALQLDPNLPDAHFRLGRYYLHAGDKDKAQNEFDTFKKLQAKHQAEEDRARAEVQQFVVSTTTVPQSQP